MFGNKLGVRKSGKRGLIYVFRGILDTGSAFLQIRGDSYKYVHSIFDYYAKIEWIYFVKKMKKIIISN